MSNTIIRASAGTGKTYQLSNRFLNQLFKAESVAEGLRSMLATTFSCKAAGEIQDRIIAKLALIAVDSKQRDALAGDLVYPQVDGKTTQELLSSLLFELIQNMERIRVSTLDSFFGQIGETMAYELGIPRDKDVRGDDELAYQELITEALREALNDRPPEEIETLLLRLDLKKSWNKNKSDKPKGMISDLTTLVMKTLPLLRLAKQEAWKHDAPERLGDFLSGEIDDVRIKECAEIIQNTPDPKDTRIVKTRDALVGLLQSEAINWEDVLTNGIVSSVNNGTLTYYNKPISDELADGIRPLLPHAKAIIIRQLVDKIDAMYELSRMTAEKIDALMVRTKRFSFGDITRKIAERIAESNISGEEMRAFEERLGGKTRHLLLDEFQDTSMMQWRVLRPLAIQCATHNDGSFFCVGDIKQAIYGWRGGEAAIFDTIRETLQAAQAEVSEETMEETRRNRPAIIESVNTLFGSIATNSVVTTASSEAAQRWGSRFKEHHAYHQDASHFTLEESLEPKEGQNKKESHWNYTVDRIIELADNVKNRHGLDATLGVLVMACDTASIIVSRLKERGIEVNGGEGNLIDSPAVKQILSALKIADHPGHTFARFHLATGPLREALGIEESLDKERYGDASLSRRIRAELSNHGFGPTLRRWSNLLIPFYGPRDRVRLEKLVEQGFRWDAARHGARTVAFVKSLDRVGVASSGGAKISVTTIHGAKGLEYDVVVLPELNLPIDGLSQGVKTVVDYAIPQNKMSEIDLIFPYCNEEKQAILPHRYQEAFRRRIQDNVEESLSKLYVAMTRARYELVMITHPPKPIKNDSKKKTYEVVLRQGFNLSTPVSSSILVELGDRGWFERFELITPSEKSPDVASSETPNGQVNASSNESGATVKTNRCVLAPHTVRHHLPRVAPSSLHEDFDSAAIVQGGKGPVFGTAIHACFEHGVEWLDDGTPLDDEELKRIVINAIQNEKVSFTPEEVVATFHDACKKTGIVAALVRSRYQSENVTAERERPFVVRVQDKIVRGCFDRVVIERDANGKAIRVEILDYKTDAAQNVGSLVKCYREQLKAYRQAAAVLFDVDLERVLGTFVFVTLGQTVGLNETILNEKITTENFA